MDIDGGIDIPVVNSTTMRTYPRAHGKVLHLRVLFTAARASLARRKELPHSDDLSARRKILCKRFSTKSRMALESRADSGLNPLITESHGGQNGMRAGTA